MQAYDTEGQLSPRRYQPGEVVTGEVVRVDEDGIVVGVGLKTEGIIPPHEMRLLGHEEQTRLQPGDSIDVTILGGRGPGEMPMLSFDQARVEQSWVELQEKLSDGTTVTARIVEQNRGGLVAECLGIRGFIPFSHLAPTPGVDRDEGLAARIRQESEFNVLEIDREQGRLVLTERAIWQKLQSQAQERFIDQLEEGSLVDGKVTSIRDFGAFVNIGEVEGLIPISELSWRMVKTPDEVVSVGQPIQVQVLRVDKSNRRISLSLKRTQPEPWETVGERYKVGQITGGTVTNLMPFGAFVKLEDGIEGLVHVSELSQRRVNNPKECVYQGQNIQVLILSIDTQTRRIGLSYKQAFGLQ